MTGLARYVPLLIGLFIVVGVLGFLLKLIGWAIGAVLVVAVGAWMAVKLGGKKNG
jgi:hypothetical protein